MEDNTEARKSIVEYVLKLISSTLKLGGSKIEIPLLAEEVIRNEAFQFNPDFYAAIQDPGSNWRHEKWCLDGPFVAGPENGIDLFASVFYLVNGLQEYSLHHDELDQLGRFEYVNSLQAKFNCIEENLVLGYMDDILKKLRITRTPEPSRIFVSHDIDTVHGSLLQDGFNLLKRGEIGAMFAHIANQLLKKPDWLNMDQIQRLNSAYGIQSTFFWLVNKGQGTDRVQNADYRLKRITRTLNSIRENDGVNGLHKSCSEMTLKQELDTAPSLQPYHRYHFLRINLPDSWDSLDAAGMKLDSSLGFADRYGFRNSFGLPFRPYNLQAMKEHQVLEVPLTFMDGTFHKYMKLPVDETATRIIDFMEKHRNDCTFALLWHNTHFTNLKYKGFLEEYVKILSHIKESGIKPIGPKEIVDIYGA